MNSNEWAERIARQKGLAGLSAVVITIVVFLLPIGAPFVISLGRAIQYPEQIHGQFIKAFDGPWFRAVIFSDSVSREDLCGSARYDKIREPTVVAIKRQWNTKIRLRNVQMTSADEEEKKHELRLLREMVVCRQFSCEKRYDRHSWLGDFVGECKILDPDPLAENTLDLNSEVIRLGIGAARTGD
ncbi:MAG: hypothetical protein H6848_00030 [Caulobacterales bacterium]|nr:hypothetical protein [Caulobacterales bacterium]